jgi:hypothetical protein
VKRGDGRITIMVCGLLAQPFAAKPFRQPGLNLISLGFAFRALIRRKFRNGLRREARASQRFDHGVLQDVSRFAFSKRPPCSSPAVQTRTAGFFIRGASGINCASAGNPVKLDEEVEPE